MTKLNLIGSDAYIKNCSIDERNNLAICEEQAEKIASAVKEGFINIREVCGKYENNMWIGDNPGRIAEGLSRGKIQLKQEEFNNSEEYNSERTLCGVPNSKARGWKYAKVIYVGQEKSINLTNLKENNPKGKLMNAGILFPGLFVGMINNQTLIIGEKVEEVYYAINLTNYLYI